MKSHSQRSSVMGQKRPCRRRRRLCRFFAEITS